MQMYLALECGHPGFPQDTCLMVLGNLTRVHISFTYATLTLCGLPFQTVQLPIYNPILSVPQPPTRRAGMSNLQFTIYNKFTIYNLQTPQFYCLIIDSLKIDWKLKIENWKFLSYGQILHKGGVIPFGYRRIIAFWQLPGDFRGLMRPSSALAS